MRSSLLSVASSIGGGCGKDLVRGHPYWCSGRSSASFRYFVFALGLRCWRTCAVTRTCVNVGTSLVVHASISIPRNVPEEFLYMGRPTDWRSNQRIRFHLGHGPMGEQSDPLARYSISTKNVSACKQIDQSKHINVYLTIYNIQTIAL